MSLRTGRLQQTLNSVQASESESPLSSLVEGVDLLSRIDRDELRLPRAGEDLNRIRPVPLTGPLADHICFGDESIQDRFSDKIGSYTRFISDGLIYTRSLAITAAFSRESFERPAPIGRQCKTKLRTVSSETSGNRRYLLP